MIFVPCLLSDVLLYVDSSPEPAKLDHHWPHKSSMLIAIPHSDGDVAWQKIQREYGRVYCFKFLPIGFLARVTVGLLSILNISTEAYLAWQRGMVLQTTSQCAVMMTFDAVKYQLMLVVRVPSPTLLSPILRTCTPQTDSESLLRSVTDVIESIISGFYAAYASDITRYVMCTGCLDSLSLSTELDVSSCILSGPKATLKLFSLDNFAAALVRPEDTKKHSPIRTSAMLFCDICQFHIPLDALAPDLALTGLPVLHDVAVDMSTPLGKGGFGQVWRGQWQHNHVAVKELTTVAETSSHTAQSACTIGFLSFQKEVAVMSTFQHPNVLRLFGIMLAPLRMILGIYIL